MAVRIAGPSAVAASLGPAAAPGEVALIVAIAAHGPEGSGAIMLVVALEAAARLAVVAPEAALVVTFAAHGAPAITVVFVVIATARTRSAFTHEPALLVTLRGAP
jgi:hypothetical protein